MADLTEIGGSGLNFYGDYLLEDSYQALFNGGKAAVYREMSTDDPLVSAALYAINTFLKDVTWSVKAASEDKADEDAAQFLRECMDDMSFTWGETVSESLSMLEYGWAFHEIIYKKRGGESQDPTKNSRFTDGRIGWRKMPLRSQDSLAGWVFDDTGGIQGMKQYVQGYKVVTIPIEKALLFRVNTRKNNPEGQSILRGAVRAWHLKKNVEVMEGIGLERDLAGFPVYNVPADILSARPDEEQLHMRNQVVAALKDIRSNKLAYLLNPSNRDADGNPMYEFKLVTSGGTRQFDTSKIIGRYNVQILMTMLADIIFLGHGDTGSYALGETKAQMLTRSLNNYIRTIKTTHNRFSVPRLFALNGYKLDALPEIDATELDEIDLGSLGSFVQSAGFVMDDDLENALRQKAKLPKKPEVETDAD